MQFKISSLKNARNVVILMQLVIQSFEQKFASNAEQGTKQYADAAVYNGQLNERQAKQGIGKYTFPNSDV